MRWFKMPKNLEEFGIEDKYAPLVCEIMYFSNSKNGLCSYTATSLMTKYNSKRWAFDQLINNLVAANILQKGTKKGQYYCNFTWDEQQKTDKRTAKQQQTNSKRTATLTIEENRIDKNIYIPPLSSPTKKFDKGLVENVINYLNTATNKKFSTTSKKTIQFIEARRKENYNLEDFKKVIDTKYAEWRHDAKMNKFLRPETLFGNKFESYLNEFVEKKPDALLDFFADEVNYIAEQEGWQK